MSNPDSRPLDCPSAQAGASDARVYGVRAGTPDAPRVGYLTETLPVSEKLSGTFRTGKTDRTGMSIGQIGTQREGLLAFSKPLGSVVCEDIGHTQGQVGHCMVRS